MNQYFIGRTSKNLADLIKSNYKDATTYAYFVDEKIDEKQRLNHLVINNSTFSNIG